MATTIDIPTGATPAPEDPAHVAAMIAKADGVAPPPSTENPAETPQLFAGKYKTVEELEKGYAELQKTLSQRKPTDTPETPTDADKKDPLEIPETPTDAQEILESKGLDFAAFEAEFVEKGALSAETYTALEKAGIPKSVVDNYIQGQQVIADQQTAAIFGIAGGEEQYASLVQWASTNLPKADIEAYNKTVQSGDITQIQLATRGLKATFDDANGQQPQLLTADATSNTSNAPFRSKSEMTAAMSDPRYAKDPAYRQDVALRLSRSTFL